MPLPELEDLGLRASVDRARVYRALARLFGPPDAHALEALRQDELPALRGALERLGSDAALTGAADEVTRLLACADPGSLQRGFQATFEAGGGLRCSPNEAAHTADTPGHALTRTVEIADVAGFYRAFGVEVAPGTERPDHITAELEFMHLLAVKESVARSEEGDGERVAVCRDAVRTFLRDHLGRWAQRFAERLKEVADDPVYVAAGRLLRGFVARDAERLGAH
jgi:DMSO reductase family type II enzyme chaperone